MPGIPQSTISEPSKLHRDAPWQPSQPVCTHLMTQLELSRAKPAAITCSSAMLTSRPEYAREQLLAAQTACLERQWASSTVALCLALARSAPSYSHSKLFAVPLAECDFTDYSIDTTSQNTLGVAPLFSQKWETSQALAEAPACPVHA